VHLELPGRLGEQVQGEGDFVVLVEEPFTRYPAYRPLPDQDAVEKAVTLLAAAERPVMVVGGGITASDARTELVALAERLSIPVAVTMNGKENIPDDHPRSLGNVGTDGRRAANQVVAEAVLVGDRRKFPAALIVPDFVTLEEHLREAGAASGPRERLVARADVQAIYQAILDGINVNLAQFEKIKQFALLPREMTIEGGELTPTLKIRRKIVEQHWAAVIEQLYAREPASL